MSDPSAPDATFAQRLDHLRHNRTSGALDLALEAIDLAQDWVASGRAPGELVLELQTMHPAIATVASVARLIEQQAADLPARLKTVRKSLVGGNRRIAQKLRGLIPATASVITLSNSSTVRDALIAIGVQSVYVLESQPGGEGVQMAEALKNGLEVKGRAATVRLIPDAAMGNVAPLVDCGLVGIDTFDRSRSIVHKAGTLPLALCCRHFGRPFYAAGHSFKFTSRPFSGRPEPQVAPEAQLFDCTPGELITRLVTEEPD